jgi:hypothetical protein
MNEEEFQKEGNNLQNKLVDFCIENKISEPLFAAVAMHMMIKISFRHDITIQQIIEHVSKSGIKIYAKMEKNKKESKS